MTDDDHDSSDNEEENDSVSRRKYRRVEIEKDNLKADVKKLRAHCRALGTKVMNMAACGRQEKTKNNETNLQVAKRGMCLMNHVRRYHLLIPNSLMLLQQRWTLT